MKTSVKIFFLILFSVVIYGCTAIPEAGTRAYVYGQLGSVQIGNTPEQVQYLLNGPPHYVTSLWQGPDAYQVWEYRIGNFLHAETVMIVFKNERVFALPKSARELISIFGSIGLMPQAHFWSQSER